MAGNVPMVTGSTGGTSAFAASLRSQRKTHGLTQGELADRVGVSQGTVSFWERGIEVPNAEHLVILAGELPEVVYSLGEREQELLRRLLKAERTLFPGRCACPGCGCQDQAKTEPGSAAP